MKIGSLILGSAVLLAGVLSGSAVAATDKTPGSGPSPYTDCGIGAALFHDTKWAAVTSNVIWDLGTTAVISATASPETCSGKKLAAAQFINATYAALAEEVAAGRGDNLVAILDIFGCGSSRQPGAVVKIRSAMGAEVADPAYVDQTHLEKAASFYRIVDSAVTGSCSA
jgi:Protein of unknown function (DUF3015)